MTKLVAENVRLKSELSFADGKIKVLIIWHDNALWLLVNKLGNESLTADYDAIKTGIDVSVSMLKNEFPSLEDLVTYHEDPEGIRETTLMADWVAQPDHIQMSDEIKLRKSLGFKD